MASTFLMSEDVEIGFERDGMRTGASTWDKHERAELLAAPIEVSGKFGSSFKSIEDQLLKYKVEARRVRPVEPSQTHLKSWIDYL